MLGKLIEWKIGNPPHPPELLLCLIYGVLMICTISVLISMRSSPTGGSMSPPTILCMTRQSCAKAKRPSNSDIICVCWPILSPHLRSGWGIVMSISVLCANTSEELMCALRKAGGVEESVFSTCVVSKTEAAASSLPDKENTQVINGIRISEHIKNKV